MSTILLQTIDLDTGLSLFGPSLKEAIFSTARYAQNIALLLIPMGIMAQFGVHFIQQFFSDGNQLGDMRKPFMAILMLFVCASYVPIVNAVDGTITLVENYIRRSGSVSTREVIASRLSDISFEDQKALKEIKAQLAKPKQNAQQIAELQAKMKALNDNKKSWWEQTWDHVNTFRFSLVDMLINSITDGLTIALRYIMAILQFFVLAALVIVGPLAIAVSTLPMFSEKAFHFWVKTFVFFKCWGITMAVLDVLMDQYFLMSQNPGSASQRLVQTISGLYAPGGGAMVVSVVFIILYIMTPKITSWYLGGHTDSGIASVMGAATTVMSVGGTAAQVGGAVMTGGASAGLSMAASMFGGNASQNAQMLKTFSDMNKNLQNLNKQGK